MFGNRRKYKNIAALIAILSALGLACLCLPGGILQTNTPTSAPPPTQPSPPTQVPPVSNGLNAEGSWLLMETEQGLWAINPDGSGLTQLTDVDYWEWDLQDAIQPGGNLVVFLSPANYDFHHMTLNLLTLPSGTITTLTELTSPTTEVYADQSPGESGLEAMRAVREQRNYAWSPDGSRLAFVGLMDGPSAEIYLYNAASGEIRRVSQDEAQNYGPSWSPDGNTLLYFGADFFGTGGGFDTTGVWSVEGDGTNVTYLYVPRGGPEELIGWLDNTTAVLDTWNMGCGSGVLRLFDVVSTNTVMLNEGCFTSASADAQRGALMFSNDSGLYLLTAADRTPVQVSAEPRARIDPLGPDDYIFTVRFETGGIATYGVISDMDHQVSPVSAPSNAMDVAMYGAIWAWTSTDEAQTGAWISGPGIEIGQIYSGPASFPAWDLDNNLLFFAEEGAGGTSIYRTTFNAYYQDLSLVNTIAARLYNVVWLGAP